jgi:chromosome segregation ATPase
MLLEILNEVLGDVTKRMRQAQANIEKCEAEVREGKRVVEVFEERLKCEAYKQEQVTKKLQVLTIYIGHLEKYPHALTAKMQKLEEERKRTAEAHSLADVRLNCAWDEVNDKKTQLAVLRQEYTARQEEWREVSELASKKRANAAA